MARDRRQYKVRAIKGFREFSLNVSPGAELTLPVWQAEALAKKGAVLLLDAAADLPETDTERIVRLESQVQDFSKRLAEVERKIHVIYVVAGGEAHEHTRKT